VSDPIQPIRPRLVEPPEPASPIARRRRLEREDGERREDESGGERRRNRDDADADGHVDVLA
jgi:hypothetical protein